MRHVSQRKQVISHSPRISFALRRAGIFKCFGHVDLAAQKLVCFDLTCAVRGVCRPGLRQGHGARFELADGSLRPVGAPVDEELLRRRGAFGHGALPAQVGLAAAGEDLSSRLGADGAAGLLILIGGRRRVPLHGGSLNVADNLPVDVFV